MENLLEDMTAEEMRLALQEVSEYMEKVIVKARRLAKQNGKPVIDREEWRLAHDVLEIIFKTR